MIKQNEASLTMLATKVPNKQKLNSISDLNQLHIHSRQLLYKSEKSKIHVIYTTLNKSQC